MDIRGELETIVQTSGFSRAKLAMLLKNMTEEKEEKRHHRPREHASPVTQYTAIKRNYTCLHCGHQFSNVVELKKGEDTAVTTAEGKIMIINSASPAEISCIVSNCASCQQFLSTLPREELERRYMTLLKMVSLAGKPNPFGYNLSIESHEVRL